jgi:hypothetical protein
LQPVRAPRFIDEQLSLALRADIVSLEKDIDADLLFEMSEP